MSKEQKITTDIKVPNKDLEALRINFPHCFDKDGNFQLEKFKNNLTEKEINFSTESYGLDWLGKSYARLLASDPATTLLKEDETHNSKAENTNSENLLLKGDNLEVLKHLVGCYREKIKMIYIDPPYNTGSDGFVYEDDRKFTVTELQQLIGVDAEKAKRILDFTQQKSNSHSAWLTFMYPRLYIAKELLKDDGVIFISIDDSEVAQLKILMDEVFGEENFINQISVKAKGSSGASGGGEDKKMKKNIEHLICYTKSNGFDRFNNIYSEQSLTDYINERKINGKTFAYTNVLINEGTEKFEKTIKAGNGEDIEVYSVSGYKTKSISSLAKEEKITIEEAYLKYYEKVFTTENAQTSIRDRVKEALPNFNGLINIYYSPVSGRNKGIKTKVSFEGATKRLISYLENVSEKTNGKIIKKDIIGTLWSDLSWSSVSSEGGLAYPNGKKPIDLIKRMLLLTSSETKDDIILDFFAGSGSTAHAVIDLNSIDFGNRKSISIQIDEPISAKDKKEYYSETNFKVIFDITKERLNRSVSKIQEYVKLKIQDKETEIESLQGKLDLEGKEEKIQQLQSEIKSLTKQDLGFKIFETKPIWEDYDFESTELDNQTKLFDESKLTEDDIKALLITWKTYDGIALTQELVKIDLSGYTAYYGNGKLYLMDKGFTTENLKNLLEKIDSDKKFSPTSIITFGYHFESKNLRELSENVKSYSNKKNIDIDFITRY
jgi:adenine-specific DNA-methyltransferase